MIFSSLFKKGYDNQYIMEKYIERQRKLKSKDVMNKSSKLRRRKTVKFDRASTSKDLFALKNTVTPKRKWGMPKEPKVNLNPVELKTNEKMYKLHVLKQDINTLRESFKTNDVNEFKRLTGYDKRKRNNQSHCQVESKVKADIMDHTQTVESKCNSTIFNYL
jgi:hypothetical protein